MRKVGFHLYNIGISDVDFRRPLDGNPGVGGSEYLIVLTAWQLSVRNNDIHVKLFAEQKGLFPDGLPVHVVDGDIDQTIKVASQEGYDILVVDHKRLKWDQNPFHAVSGKLRIICWCHNFVGWHIAKIMQRSSVVERVIAVGREQMDLFRDDVLFHKLDYIYNSVHVQDEFIEKSKFVPYNKRPHSVAYLGSLVKQKSFHILASIWPSVLKEVPDAELYVIGSGNVYSKDSKLGKFGIAAEKYEEEFMQYLTDKNGNILSSVHFLGSLGKEKFDVLKTIRIGCPNPTGLSETFCLSAVEMQMMGCCVAAMEAPGYYDTFYNGVLSHSVEELTKDIVRLLKGSQIKDFDDTVSFLRKNFSVEAVMSDWERLLSGFEGHLHPILPLSHPDYRVKRWKEYSRRLREKFTPLYCLPNMERVISIIEKIFNRHSARY